MAAIKEELQGLDPAQKDVMQQENAQLKAINAELLGALQVVDDFEAYVVDESDPEIKERNQAWIKQARATIAKATPGAAQKVSPQSIVSMTDEARDARIREIDIEPEP